MKDKDKICFVIMGFGKKTDYATGRTLNLDKTYSNIIRPAVIDAGLECIRADEIQDSGIIDRSMYAMLMLADVVVADITTSNPNAIYELGVRHAVRPHTTIIIKEKQGKIPFDLDHTKIFHYEHLGEDIGSDEATRCRAELSKLIRTAMERAQTDSPLYSYINGVEPPTVPEDEYKKIIPEMAEKEKSIYPILQKAKECMRNSKFLEAAELWQKASQIHPNEEYFVQQRALATYKSKKPSESVSLTDALLVIEELLKDGDTNDPETLGITGAIYKRKWMCEKEVEYLLRAKSYYEKGFQLNNDYYTGENYALCLDMLAGEETDIDQKTYYKVAAKMARKKIIELLKSVEETVEDEMDADMKWACATLANCHFGLSNIEQGEKFEKMFFKLVKADWEKETYRESKRRMLKLISN